MSKYGPPPAPHPSPEQVLDAVAVLELGGAPVHMGEIGWYVAPAIGVDTRLVTTTYDLRGHMSWTILRRELDTLVGARHLERMSEMHWCDASGGALFSTGRPRENSWAYATPPMAARFRSAAFWAQGGAQALREESARTWALGALAERHAQEYEVLLEQWAAEHPAVRGTATDGAAAS